MKLINKIKRASVSKNKKDKKKISKKIDKKILKALKERYLKAVKDKKEAKAAYRLAKTFFEKSQPKKKVKAKTKSVPKKAKKKPTTSKNKKPEKKPAVPKKPASNAIVTTLSQLKPTPTKVANKLPKPLRIKKAKPTTKSTPKTSAKTSKVTPPKKTVATPKSTAKPVVKPTPRPKPTPKPTISKKQMEDLKVVEGVGPAIERLLKANGIKTLTEFSKTRIGTLRQILEDAGSRFRFHKPDTWARQARLAAAGRWKELDVLQKNLDGGKKK